MRDKNKLVTVMSVVLLCAVSRIDIGNVKTAMLGSLAIFHRYGQHLEHNIRMMTANERIHSIFDIILVKIVISNLL